MQTKCIDKERRNVEASEEIATYLATLGYVISVLSVTLIAMYTYNVRRSNTLRNKDKIPATIPEIKITGNATIKTVRK